MSIWISLAVALVFGLVCLLGWLFAILKALAMMQEWEDRPPCRKTLADREGAC